MVYSSGGHKDKEGIWKLSAKEQARACQDRPRQVRTGQFMS